MTNIKRLKEMNNAEIYRMRMEINSKIKEIKKEENLSLKLFNDLTEYVTKAITLGLVFRENLFGINDDKEEIIETALDNYCNDL